MNDRILMQAGIHRSIAPDTKAAKRRLPGCPVAPGRHGALVVPRGFSLVEIMVVLVIIGLLAGLVTVNVRGFMVRGKQDTARSQIATFKQALDTWYGVYSRYPTNEEGLEVLTRKSDKLSEPLMERIPVDPWSHAYQYNQPGRSGPYEVISFGGDGREGGEGGDTDISSDNLSDK